MLAVHVAMVWTNYVQEQCKICLKVNSGMYIKMTWCIVRSIFVQWLQRYDVNMKAHIVVGRQTMTILTHLWCVILSMLINIMLGTAIYLHVEAEPNLLPFFKRNIWLNLFEWKLLNCESNPLMLVAKRSMDMSQYHQVLTSPRQVRRHYLQQLPFTDEYSLHPAYIGWYLFKILEPRKNDHSVMITNFETLLSRKKSSLWNILTSFLGIIPVQFMSSSMCLVW